MVQDECPYCGDAESLGLQELWPEDRSFLLAFCCEANQDEILFESRYWDRQIWAWFFQATCGIHVRQVYEDDGRYQLDFDLTIEPIAFADARAFIAEHHRHNCPPRGWKFGFAIHNGPERIGVCTVGRPVARQLDNGKTLEVTRVCINPEKHPALVWNACSMAYGHAAREAKRRGYDKIITYTLATEKGTSLKAAGWKPEHRTKPENWDRPSRRRQSRTPPQPKIRWARCFSDPSQTSGKENAKA